MRKKRKSIHLRPAPFLWLFLCGNLVAGYYYSKLTSVVHVRTEGVRTFDKDRIEGILAKLHDIPCSKINGRAVETEVMELPEVDHAEFSRTPLGSGFLSVQYRTPVAKLDGPNSVVLSEDGVLYPATEFSEDIPTLQVAKSGPPTLLALAGNWEPERLAELAVYSRAHFPKSEVKITVDDRGSVCLNIGSGRVVLGSCENLQLKLKTLESWLQKYPQGLDQIEELVLIQPTTPATVQKASGKHQ